MAENESEDRNIIPVEEEAMPALVDKSFSQELGGHLSTFYARC
jgi:hypothetical protein